MRNQVMAVALALVVVSGFVAGCQKESKGGGDELKCYTPCRTGAVIDGEYVECPSDGLMPVCLGGTECISGSCVAPGNEVPECESDLDCAGFQTCADRKCKSDCDFDSDCADGEGCFKHVCRPTCTAWGSSCGEQSYCSTTDGDFGFCLKLAPSDGQSPQNIGSFVLSTTSVRLSQVENSKDIVITNKTPTALEFTVRKVSHQEFTADGVVNDAETPLYWMSMGPEGSISQVDEFTIIVDGNEGQATFTLGEASTDDIPVWNGIVEVSSERVGTQRIDLTYASRPDGQWAGHIYYFGNFGTQNLTEWEADKGNTALLEQVHNAFVQKWGAFRLGSITFDNFMAVLTSTRTGSWDWASMRPPYCPKEACYPYDNSVGFGEYSDDLDSNPVPSGLVELPVALNLTEGSSAGALVGKISTSDTLHYAGDPAIAVQFTGDPSECASGVGTACLAFMQQVSSDIVVGGRYLPGEGATSCDLPDFDLFTVPWLVPGFKEGTTMDPDTGLRYRSECRDKGQPYDSDEMEEQNLAFAGSNPVPDGRSRKRHIELVDGAMINQREMVIIFRETFQDSFSFVGSADEDDFTAYGVMVLERNPATLDAEAFTGSVQTEARSMPTDKLALRCTDEILLQAFGYATPTWESNPVAINTLAAALVNGVNDDPAGVEEVDGVNEAVHYLCHDTGYIDQGPVGVSTSCPLGSNVTFFTVNPLAISQSEMDALSCQADGSCQTDLDAWQVDPEYSAYSVRLNPFWSCTTAGAVYCEDDRYDLRNGKTFYAESSAASVFVPLLSEVNNAFRYKVAFQNRSGTNVGFAPEVCVPDSNVIPYCYDPIPIEEVQERIDCLIYLDLAHNEDLTSDNRTMVKDYLTINFSVDEIVPGRSVDGFEALYAELLVMMGDESYTQAFASRFDLAGVDRATFEGSLFEPDGINLSGVAGHEMFTLYQAAQYYQMALDRFYSMMPYLWQSLNSPAAVNFVTQETVTNYFDRLNRASTQKSRAWSEVAKRYQGFNRPDLARLVVERAYTSTYLESVLVTRMMQKVVEVVEPEDRDQILMITDQAQRQYKMALLDMRDVYKGITDDVNYFGFSPDYIPFPALDDGGNAFDMIIASAWNKVAFASEKESLALDKSREYETDSASFQAELVSIRNNYEDQLADLCGTFEGPDGLIYPAIGKYAYLDEKAKFLGDPCGYMGNGSIHEAMAGMEIAAIDLRQQILRRDNALKSIDIEIDRVSEYCGEVLEASNYIFEFYETQSSLQDQIDQATSMIETCKRAMDFGFQIAEFVKCSVGTSTDCPMTAGAMAAATAAYIGNEALIIIQDLATAEAKAELVNIERDKARFETEQECDIAEIDSNANVANLYIGVTEIELDILRAYYELKLSFDQIEALRNEAKRLEVEQQDVEELAINIEAARNDPNVRIYKNDAIINADKAFESAIREAYKATRVYEYYTSQAYEKVDQLFLIRMISAGDYNLENYLVELEEAYYEFEESYGNPDLRVQVISLRDDILNVPRIEENGEALTESERLEIFQQMLADPVLLDQDGYLTIDFSTDVEGLSPLTRNHKIYYVEAEIVGSDTGDTLGRIYLRQQGTGTVHSVGDDKIYYVFPDRTAVINTFFNGDRGSYSSDSIYTSMRLRDRPFANTLWQLVFNQRDEDVNKDINLASLTDIRLYVYYTDFTEM